MIMNTIIPMITKMIMMIMINMIMTSTNWITSVSLTKG